VFLPADNQNDYDLYKTKSNHLGIQSKEYITNVSMYRIIHLFLQLVGLLSHPNELISAEAESKTGEELSPSDLYDENVRNFDSKLYDFYYRTIKGSNQ